MKIQTAEFVESVGPDSPLPDPRLPQVSLVGRSNVGKSTLINALARRRIARAGGAPGTTRLLNVYRIVLARRRGELLLIDLPGYGYARGGAASTRVFDRLTERYFRRAPAPAADGPEPSGETGPRAARGPAGSHDAASAVKEREAGPRAAQAPAGAILLVDARHPGLENDRNAVDWLAGLDLRFVVAATKLDRLARSARHAKLRAHEQALSRPVLPISAKRGDGLPALWTALLDLAGGAPREGG